MSYLLVLRVLLMCSSKAEVLICVFLLSVGFIYSYYNLIINYVWLGFQGRSKNVWESPKGCLLFSFTIQMEDGRIVPLVQYVVSLAMTEGIKDVCRRNVSASTQCCLRPFVEDEI